MCALPFHVRRNQVAPNVVLQPKGVVSHEQQTLTKKGGRSLTPLGQGGLSQWNGNSKAAKIMADGVLIQTRIVTEIVSSHKEEAPSLAPFGADHMAWVDLANSQVVSSAAAQATKEGVIDAEGAKYRARLRVTRELKIVKVRRKLPVGLFAYLLW